MKIYSQPIAAAAVITSAITGAASSPLSYCVPDTQNVCYKVGVPSSTASKGSGNIYMQISAPTSYQWVALGTGDGMVNSNMFIMYQDGKGNLTLSPRHGTRHTMPQFDQTGAKLTLLAGSGVQGSNMVANILCSNCQSWSTGALSVASSRTAWIAAWKSGNSLASTNQNAILTQHDETQEFNFDLTQAAISADSNPFVGSTGGTGGNGSNGGNGQTGSGGQGGSGGTTGGSGVTVTGSGRPNPTILMAHGIIMSMVMVILYPLGSMLMPLLGKWVIHGAWQFVTYLLMWAGFALGIIFAQSISSLYTAEARNHTIIGTTVVCAMGIQPALGFLHHRHYVRHQGRGLISHIHIWYGRALMVLGVINGGLGLQLARASNSIVIAYSVVAAVIALAYVGAKVFGVMRRRRGAPAVRSKENGHESLPESGHSEHGHGHGRRDYGPEPPRHGQYGGAERDSRLERERERERYRHQGDARRGYA